MKNYRTYLLIILMPFVFTTFLFAADRAYIQVVVSNVRDASIYIDGKYCGHSPVTEEVSTSIVHIVRVEKYGYKTVTERIQAVSGYTKTLTVIMDKITGDVEVNSNVSGASVYLDGSYKGLTPLTIRDVTPGYHNLKLTKYNYKDVYEQIYVVSERTNVVNVKFIGAKLYAMANQPGATVYIDNIKKGGTPIIIEDIEPGYHTVEITKKHYSLVKESLYFRAGYETTYTAELVKISGNLSVKTNPDFASVSIYGKENTKIADNYFEVDEGMCTISASAFGYEEASIDTTIKRNKTTYESLTLKEAEFDITSLQLDKEKFNPQNKNVNNNVKIQWHVTAPESGWILVKSASGETVYSQGVIFRTWNEYFIWDGKSDDQFVPAGSYTIYLEAGGISRSCPVEIDYTIKDYLQLSRGAGDYGTAYVNFALLKDEFYSGKSFGLSYLNGDEHIYGGVGYNVSYMEPVAKASNGSNDMTIYLDIDAIIGFSLNYFYVRPYVQGELGYYRNFESDSGGLALNLAIGADVTLSSFQIGASYIMKNYVSDSVKHGVNFSAGWRF